jgi:tetratricopeptide (TPR) repeat protein
MRWSVGITLYADRAYFETETRLFNRTHMPNRFWFWANSAAPKSSGLEFVSTATKVMTLTDIIDFPVHNGVDIHWDKNHAAAQDMFSLDLKQDFVAWYNHDTERGMINYGDRSEAPGKKFFTWGNSDDGNIWVDLLTDNDGPYSEMQSGRLHTMRMWEIMSPMSVETWKEMWYPVRKIGTPVFANKEAALAFSYKQNKIHLGIFVTSSQPKTEVVLSAEGEKVWSEQTDIDPQTPFITEISFKNKTAMDKKLVFSLISREGAILAEHIVGGEPDPRPEVELNFKIEPRSEAINAEDLWKKGVDHEKIGEPANAEEAYKGALEADPGFSPAHRSLGILYLRRGNFDEAEAELRKALERNDTDEAARFFLGACFMGSEQFKKAIAELRMIPRSMTYGAASAYLLGGIYLGQGMPESSIDWLKKSVDLYPENLDALAFYACALRKKKDFVSAKSVVQEVLIKDPLCFPALAESYFLSVEDEKADTQEEQKRKLMALLRNCSQSSLELATDYTRFGLYREGIKILSLYEESDHKEEPSPLVWYYMGYFHEKINEMEEAGRYYKMGAKQDPSFVFPHRVESESVLQSAISALPDDGRAGYYLGNLLCSKQRSWEAIESWEQAARKESRLSVVHRNLGRTYFRLANEVDRAIKEYELALECDPQDYKLYYELDKIYTSCGLDEKRGELIKKIPGHLLVNDIIAERIAAYHTDIYEFDAALEILRKTKFYPWEFYTEGRRIFEEANIGKGISLLNDRKPEQAIAFFNEVMNYPRNIGVGEPSKKGHAEAYYRIGVCFDRLGKSEKAKENWEKAAGEEHSDWNALKYYEAKALQGLGKTMEADLLLDELFENVQASISCLDSICDKKIMAENLYLLGLAFKGKGLKVSAFQYFKKAHTENNAHRRSRWELSGFSW